MRCAYSAATPIPPRSPHLDKTPHSKHCMAYQVGILPALPSTYVTYHDFRKSILGVKSSQAGPLLLQRMPLSIVVSIEMSLLELWLGWVGRRGKIEPTQHANASTHFSRALRVAGYLLFPLLALSVPLDVHRVSETNRSVSALACDHFRESVWTDQVGNTHS